MKRTLNLLPWSLQCRMLIKQRLRQWAVAWTAIVLVGIAVSGTQWWRLLSAEQECQSWERRAEGIQAIQFASQQLRGKIAGQQERLAKYGHLENEKLGFQLLGTLSQCAASCGGKIQVQKLSFNVTQAPVTEPETAPDKSATPAATRPVKMRDVRVLTLGGVAMNNLAVAQLVSALRDSGAFDSVELKTSQSFGDARSGVARISPEGVVGAAAGLRTYQVECMF